MRHPGQSDTFKIQWSWRKAWAHFRTITYHKILVMRHCFKIGLYRQGLTHDLSKYSWTEFRIGVLYFQGDRSPNTAERTARGFSEAWLHHKGRNKHHYEYWIDFRNNGDAVMEGKRMPRRFVLEMVCDRVAASKVYQDEYYTDQSPLEYYHLEQTMGDLPIHPKTAAFLEYLLTLVATKGEKEAFRIMRDDIVRGKMYKDKKN